MDFRSPPRVIACAVIRLVRPRPIGPHGRVFPGHFRSRLRVTPVSSSGVVRCRQIGPSRGGFSGAFSVVPRVTACGVVRVSPVSSDRACRARVDELSRSRRPRGPTRQDFEHVIDDLSCLSSSRERIDVSRSRARSTNCRAFVVREARRDTGGRRAGQKAPLGAVIGTVYSRRCFHFVWPGF